MAARIRELANPGGALGSAQSLGNGGPDQKPFAIPDSPPREPRQYEQESAVINPYAPDARNRTPEYPTFPVDRS